jgi:DedD protein
MGLLSFLKRKELAPEPAPRGRKAKPAATPSADAVQQARLRARRRLIGAVLLLGIGVIGFPLLFETQPRPIPVDLPIEIPRKEGAAPLPLPVARPAQAPVVASAPSSRNARPQPQVITETADDAGREVAKPEPPAPVAEKEAAPAPKPVAKAQDKQDKPAEERHAAADNGRFVVQVGAFGETTAAREARQKVEKLGLRTYTQVVETDAGKRIRVRVGPFSSRDEAQQAVAKLRSAGLGGNVLTL